jgi:ABC-type uncharacterized transport system substrate-binding protein
VPCDYYCCCAPFYRGTAAEKKFPTDLPVQQPTKFELVIDLKSAEQLGVTISSNVLARANKVIR